MNLQEIKPKEVPARKKSPSKLLFSQTYCGSFSRTDTKMDLKNSHLN